MITITDTFHSNRLYDIETEIIKKYGDKKTVYFDIETTGFSSKSQQIYLIGAAYQNDDGTFTVLQWFDDTSRDEAKMLLIFREFLKDFDVLINFNGNQFDIPFVLARAVKYGIHFPFEQLILMDIYKDIRKYKKFFKTPDLKQKSIEAFLGIAREDEYNGGQLIEVYKEFLKIRNNDELKNSLRSLLLLHNHDDIIGLVNICDILAYTRIFSGSIHATKILLESSNILINCQLDFQLRMPLFDMCEYPTDKTVNDKLKIRYEAKGNSLKILIPIIEDELKYFYENYKDYFYLPDEDTAIHKSVAQFVDKNYRKKATKENCYIKKKSSFAPQPIDVFKPAFKYRHNDKHMFFEINDEIMDNLSIDNFDLYVRELFISIYL